MNGAVVSDTASQTICDEKTSFKKKSNVSNQYTYKM